MTYKKIKCLFITTCLTIVICSGISWSYNIHHWTDDQIATLRILWLGSLSPLPEDPSNNYSDNSEAAALGKKIFSDTRFSGNGKVSCATCHPANSNFTDNLSLGQGMGSTTRRTMPLIGVAYNSWFFWDGRKDSLWSQALGPIESAVEHGFTRTQCIALISRYYKADYEQIFGPLPVLKDIPPAAKPSPGSLEDHKAWTSIPEEKRKAINRVYSNMGKSIAAYVRTIIPGPSRFDRYVEAVLRDDIKAMQKLYSAEEVRGLKLFIGKANCFNCHNGPLFTDSDFHNIGIPQPENLPPDNGRFDGIARIVTDEFNCRSIYSDADMEDCSRLPFVTSYPDVLKGAFKTPTLRNVSERAPYMHTGQFPTLYSVLEFYRDLKPEQRSQELEHSELSDNELRQLEAFLFTLRGLVE